MKTKTKVTELTHDELANIISTASSSSEWLGCDYSQDDYAELTEEQKQGVFYEDKLADLLLAGKTITLLDYYADDENDHYGNLPCEYRHNAMRYTASLQDFFKGIEICLDGDEYLHKCAYDIACEDGTWLDSFEADTLMQVILFGEQVYNP